LANFVLRFNFCAMADLLQEYLRLLEPSPQLIADMQKLDGDILILGAGGKMGPALSKLAMDALRRSGAKRRIIAVSRFSEEGLQRELNEIGAETIAADLLEDRDLQSLPEIKNVLYLAGMKFGTSGKESLTWAMNAYLPGRVAEKFKHSNIVAFSTGNVYPLTPVEAEGATELMQPSPIGEYAQSCLGRERIFQYFSSKNNTPVFIYRLNYANDIKYGVLVDLAKSVWTGKPIDLSMGHVNIIWQNDANEIALRALLHCSVPARVLNITGLKTLSVRSLAEEIGKQMNKKPLFTGKEQPTALLSNALESVKYFGAPGTTVEQMIWLISAWVIQDGATINKPTHFQERQGQF